MGGDINIELRRIFILMFAVTQGLSDNVTRSPPSLTPVTVPQTCQGSGGQLYNIGDVWEQPNKPNTECSCERFGLVTCLERKILVMACRDQHLQIKNPGDEWLINATTRCHCSQHNTVSCLRLREPACMDSSGKLRSDKEMWMKNDCIKCECFNDGSIICTRYEVNVTYGLFEVKTHVCERCVHLTEADSYVACKAFFGTAARYRPKMFRCFIGDYYIWDSHRCNGILDCPDGSDEEGCEDKMCKDEEGALYLIEDSNFGRRVSPCLNCHCTGGLLTCKTTVEVNFPGWYRGYYLYEEDCTQPSCKVSQFIRDNKDKCQGVEILENKGILFKGQTWNYRGCEFYFPGPNDEKGAEICLPMVKPICYVYNGAVCCAFHCPALKRVSKQIRGNLSVCSNGHQLLSPDIGNAQCKTSNCLRNYSMPNCTTEITCQDENFNKYFENTTWSVGECIRCSCSNGNIKCTRKVSVLASSETFFENCNQTECNVGQYIEENKGNCKACRWNGRVYYDGDHWKENDVDFYCVSGKRLRPGCYVGSYRAVVECTGAIKGVRNLSLISKDDLFLCDSGDEIIWGKYRCDLSMDCYDFSDEKNCSNHFCHSEIKFGLQWPRSKIGEEISMECSLTDSTLTGTFSSKCVSQWGGSTVWFHKHKCGCVKKTLVDYFKRKIQEINETNLMNISTEIIGSHTRFKNKEVFHETLNDLFEAVTTVISPITTNNSKLAIQFSEEVIQLELYGDAFYVGVNDNAAICKQPDLEQARFILANRVLEFLRTAPNTTDAYFYGLQQIPRKNFRNPWPGEKQFGNFLRKRHDWIPIKRMKLIV